VGTSFAKVMRCQPWPVTLAPTILSMTEIADARPSTRSSRSVLQLGDVDPHVMPRLGAAASPSTVISARDAITLQLDRRFDLVIVGPDINHVDEEQRRAVIHAALQHTERRGHVVVFGDVMQQLLADAVRTGDLRPDASFVANDDTAAAYQRGERTTIHDLLFDARATISRVTPAELAERMRTDACPTVLDTRTHTDRQRFGVIPGALHTPRTVLEWHVDPANGYLHPAIHSFDQPLVVVCNGGYSSSLAAANLVQLGFTNVADLIGGHAAWVADGLPLDRPDHSHLDTPSISVGELADEH
jgi:rhodanese-related sulfurtransferase